MKNKIMINKLLKNQKKREDKMTDKKRLIIGSFLILFTAIGASGFGWNYFLNSNTCTHARHEINRIMDNQDDLLMTYGLFAKDSLSEDKQLAFHKLIDIKEPLLRVHIEHFKDKCQSREKELLGFLKGFEIYIVSKQQILKQNEYQNNKWLKEQYPE